MKKYFSLYIFMLCGLLYATDTAALTYTCDSPGCDNLTISNTSGYDVLKIEEDGIAENINFSSNKVNISYGVLNNSVINSGYLQLYGTSVTNNLLLNGGQVYLYAGTEINNLTGKDADGSIYSFSKAADENDNLIIHNGLIYTISLNDESENITVLNGGVLETSFDRILRNSYIHAGGKLIFSSSYF